MINKFYKSHALIALLLLLVLSIACNGSSILGGNQIEGSGVIETRAYEVSDFSTLIVSGSGEVIVTQGEQPALSITADENFFEYITVENLEDTLEIGQESLTNFVSDDTIRYEVTVVDLQAYELRGSANMTAEQLSADSLSLSVLGSGNIVIDELVGNTLSVLVSGSGDVTLGGRVDAQTIEINGSGSLVLDDLESQSADIDVSGSGDVSVWATTTLNVNIAGSGDVIYSGSPTLTESVNGSGSVEAKGGN